MNSSDHTLDNALPLRTRRALIAAGALAVCIIVATALAWLYPYWFPKRYVPDIERAAAPTIAAIEAYAARVGHPPASLSDLLPEYDASSAGTGFPPQREFWYSVPIVAGKVSGSKWHLSLSTGLLNPHSALLQYDSWRRSWTLMRTGRR